MTQSKEFFTRIQHKHDIEANWSKAVNFVPLNGEIIVYDKDDTHDYARIKIGDGSTKINELPFILNDSVLYTEQTLAEGQKRQARTNINAYGFDWHSLGQYRGYVANIEGQDSITDWEALLSVPSSTITGACAFAVLAQAIDNLLDGDNKNIRKYNVVKHFNSAMSDLISAGFSLSKYRFVYTKDISNTNKYRFIWLLYLESRGRWVISDESTSLTSAVHITSGTITFDNTLTYTDTTLSIADRTADAKAVGDALAAKADKEHIHTTEEIIDFSERINAVMSSIEAITLDEIDEICGFVTEGALLETDVDELMAQLED